MANLLIIAYIAYLVGLGYLWYRWLANSPPWSWTQLFWSFALGSIVWAYVQFLLNVFNLPSQGLALFCWQGLSVAIPLVVASGRFRHSGGRKPESIMMDPGFRRGDGMVWLNLFLGILIGISLLTAALQALAVPLHMWDSIVIYGFKAKILFAETTFKTAAFQDPSVFHNATDYPLLVPYLESGFYRWLGHTDDRAVRLLFLAYWGSWLGLVYDALRWRLRAVPAGAWVSVLATLPLFSGMFMGQAVSGFADIPLALYWTGFLTAGFRIWQGGAARPWGLVILSAIGCLFTKNEGVPIVVFGLLILAMGDPLKDRRGWIVSAIFITLLVMPWWWVRHSLPHNASHYARWPTGPLAQMANAFRKVSLAYAREALSLRSWGIYWPLVLAGLLCPRKAGCFPRESLVILALVGLQLVVYGYVYSTYPWPLDLLLPVTVQRLLIHAAGPLTIAVGWRWQWEDRVEKSKA
jgi:hypothetical protein